MNIDYVMIGPEDCTMPSSIWAHDYAGHMLLHPCSATDMYTFNDRQLTFFIKNRGKTHIADYINLVRPQDKDNIKKALHGTKATWSRGEFSIEGHDDLAIIINPLRSNIMITDAESIECGKCQDITDESLLFVEFMVGDFIPLRIGGNAIKCVFDTWYKFGLHGFACAVNTALKDQKLLIEGRMSNGKYAQFSLVYNANKVAVNAKNIMSETLIPIYKKMGATKHPILPRKSPFVPNSIVLTNSDFDEVEEMIRKALSRYPHLKDYGDKVERFEVNMTGDSWDLGIDDSASLKLKYFDPNNINIIKLQYNKKDCKKSDAYLDLLKYFWEEEISWRFNRQTIRALTIVEGDNIPLPIDFRKKFKLRYIDMLCKNGSMKPFIVNKY